MQILVDDPQLPKHAINLRTADSRYHKKTNFQFQQNENLVRNRLLITMPQARRVINILINYNVRNLSGLNYSSGGEILIVAYRNDGNTLIKSVSGIGSDKIFGYPVIVGNDIKLPVKTYGNGVTINEFDVDVEIKTNNDSWSGSVTLTNEVGTEPTLFCENINTEFYE
jgi:hypothetical protein